ncbi:MAG TPA: RNA-binding protein [Tepidisphaeraceae bacterium]|jgi:RNA recognition motif-containing protein|nr:RNA-binding protein [Tepidisphaeraceae bacterium]
MAQLIQVGNLPGSVDSLVLQQLFEVHGAVRSAMIARHFDTGSSTGVGFIEMASAEGAAAAIAALNRQEHYGRVLSVCWSEGSENQIADPQQMFGPMNMTSDEAARKGRDQQ